MGNVVTNVCTKFNCNQLHVDKGLGNWKSDKYKKDKNKNKNNVHNAWEPSGYRKVLFMSLADIDRI